MKNTYLIGLLLLAGCGTRDNYTVIPNTCASQEKLSNDLKSCRHEAFAAYYDGRSEGVIAGSVVGGGLGGVISGSMDSGEMKTSDINPYIETCMKKKGYVGTSIDR